MERLERMFNEAAARAAPASARRPLPGESDSDDDKPDPTAAERIVRAHADGDFFTALGLPLPDCDDAGKPVWDVPDGVVSKAFRKASLRVHPDKNPSEDAAVQFQTLQKVYGVLSDADKRRVYDETGRFDDADGLSDEKFNSLYEYYRGIYKQVTEEDIESFELEYRGGDEEKKDLLEAYEKFAGNMSKVFMWVMCSEEAVDSHRFADVVDAAVDAGESKRYPAFTSWAAKIRKKPAPKDPLKPRPKKKKKAASAAGGGEGDLMAIIQARQNARAAAADDLFARLEEKYGGGKSPKKKAKGGGKKK